MAGHPLRSATDRRFGGPLPRQLANQTRVHPVPPEFFTLYHAVLCAYAVLAVISNCYPPVQGRLPTRYSPVRHSNTYPPKHQGILVRLACVRHAASVHPEPGSNSLVKSLIRSKISLASLNRFYCFRLFWNVLSNFKARPNRLLFLEFSGFYILFSFQGSLVAFAATDYSLALCPPLVNNFFLPNEAHMKGSTAFHRVS